MHVSLPPVHDPNYAGQLDEVIRIVRALGMEADLEGPVPAAMQSSRVSMGAAHRAARDERHLSPVRRPPHARAGDSGVRRARAPMDRCRGHAGSVGVRAGAVSFAGEERAGTTPLRRNAQLAGYWSRTFSQLKEIPAAAFQAGSRSGVFPAAFPHVNSRRRTVRP